MQPLNPIRLGWPVSNVWLLRNTEIGPLLIDTGMVVLWPVIRRGLRRHGLQPRDLAAVFLTHLHSDHAGNAARLFEEHGVPVYAHPKDGAVLGGTAPRYPLKAEGRGVTAMFCHIENRFPARTLSTRPLEEGSALAGMDVYWMPGHTEGSVFLHHQASGTLFTGDTLLNGVPPLIHRTRLSLPCAPFCRDYPRAIESLRTFLDLDLEVRLLCSGHGPPRTGPVAAALQSLLSASPDRRKAAWLERGKIASTMTLTR